MAATLHFGRSALIFLELSWRNIAQILTERNENMISFTRLFPFRYRTVRLKAIIMKLQQKNRRARKREPRRAR